MERDPFLDNLQIQRVAFYLSILRRITRLIETFSIMAIYQNRRGMLERQSQGTDKECNINCLSALTRLLQGQLR